MADVIDALKREGCLYLKCAGSRGGLLGSARATFRGSAANASIDDAPYVRNRNGWGFQKADILRDMRTALSAYRKEDVSHTPEIAATVQRTNKGGPRGAIFRRRDD